MTDLSVHHQVPVLMGWDHLPPVQGGCFPVRMIQFKDVIQAIYTVPEQTLPTA